MLCLAACLISGCGDKTTAASNSGGSGALAGSGGSNKPPGASQKLIVTPDSAAVGKVVRVNLEGRFVILKFPLGRLPAKDQRLSLYRRGLKVGEIVITGPQFDDNVVADVVTGEFQVGDEARSF